MSLTTTNDELPTDSHALANTADNEPALHEDEARDMGWNDRPENMAQPLIEGVANDEIWMLVRRFNKQLFHVKAVDNVPGNLDLHTANDEEFSPDKMRANIERLYMTVIVGLMAVAKHVARLRSWNEQRRTTAFCVVYFVAWFFDLLMPLLFVLLMTLILYHPSRSFLFPPMPLALVNTQTGHIQRPRAGTLGSENTLTGAPEKHPGEAVEQEASNFVTGFASIALSSASESRADADEGGVLENAVPDAGEIATVAVDAQQAAGGDPKHVRHDKTKAPMQEAMWQQTRPIMHALADACDTWERVGNALSPTPPFPKELPKYKVAGVVAPLFLVSLFVNSAMLVKGTTFGLGAFFFGWPLIWRGIAWLNTHYPNWQRLLEIRNTILSGVPTNAQLTITLLRIGEARKMPIPPPPVSTTPPSSEPPEHIDADDIPLDVTQAELDAATKPLPPSEDDDKPKKRKGSKMLGFLRATARTGVETVLGADRLKAVVGGEHARNRIGILPRHVHSPLGPVDFAARYKGDKGRLYVLTTSTTPCVAFAKGMSDGEDVKPMWSIAVEDVRELRKVGGLGWKAKLIVGWAMEREVADALQIVDREGKKWTLTAMQMRDELFNRLVAMGTQKWELC
ncbi:hypothetical protein EXIGLDRAFT_666523 [Exidia glandulosa HHB12029]|uniref:Uncharacterized protein n=1 Tax=Exidia glandulosa HHB12029 TaxID=1314781 RepID=A0A165NUA1_EXIGL|nr:hypothetical protein EXIGLDRAFT_666523 [Exidia glandulosa HHB12029]